MIPQIARTPDFPSSMYLLNVTKPGDHVQAFSSKHSITLFMFSLIFKCFFSDKLYKENLFNIRKHSTSI